MLCVVCVGPDECTTWSPRDERIEQRMRGDCAETNHRAKPNEAAARFSVECVTMRLSSVWCVRHTLAVERMRAKGAQQQQAFAQTNTTTTAALVAIVFSVAECMVFDTGTDYGELKMNGRQEKRLKLHGIEFRVNICKYE